MAERILVIDDSDIVLTRIRQVLVHAGYEVTTTTQTVGTARHLLSSDLVIVDYHMPGLDGGTVLASLKAALSDPASRPPFYLYTTDERANERYKELGFDGCFTRKGDPQALPPQVQAALRLRRMTRGARSKTGPTNR